MGKLDGKVAVITGASTGMALAGAKLFVEEGAHVFIKARRQEALDDAVKLIGSNAGRSPGNCAPRPSNANGMPYLLHRCTTVRREGRGVSRLPIHRRGTSRRCGEMRGGPARTHSRRPVPDLTRTRRTTP